MKNKKLAALLAAVMMGLTSCPSVPAYAMAEDMTEAAAENTAEAENLDEKPGESIGSQTEEQGKNKDNKAENGDGDQESRTNGDGLQDSKKAMVSLLEMLISLQRPDLFSGDMDVDTCESLLENPELLAALLPPLSVTMSDQAVTIRFRGDTEEGNSKEEAAQEKGTVVTQGGNLNVRTGAGMDYCAFTQLSNGSEVRVLGEENGWYQVEIPAKSGYVWGEYLETARVTPAAVTEDGTTFEIGWEQLLPLITLFAGEEKEDTTLPVQEGGLTPPGNMSLADDYGEKTGEGRQFVTMTSRNGNYFYLVIDRNEEGEENVHFLNQVDERDLLSLLEEDEAVIYEKQQEAAQKAAEEAIKEAEERARKEAEQSASASAEERPQNQTAMRLLALAGFAVLCAFGILLFRSKKKDAAQKTDPDLEEEFFENGREEDLLAERMEEE